MCVFQRVTHSVDYSYKEIHCIMEEVYYITRWTGTISGQKESRILKNFECVEALLWMIQIEISRSELIGLNEECQNIKTIS